MNIHINMYIYNLFFKRKKEGLLMLFSPRAPPELFFIIIHKHNKYSIKLILKNHFALGKRGEDRIGRSLTKIWSFSALFITVRLPFIFPGKDRYLCLPSLFSFLAKFDGKFWWICRVLWGICCVGVLNEVLGSNYHNWRICLGYICD